MELLKKTIEDEYNPRMDNSDKRELFPKERHPHTSAHHENEWSFIKDDRIRENIAYHMQYLEYLVYLYNDFQIYLTVESLLCKNVTAIIGGIVESALYAVVNQESEKANIEFDERTPFIQLIQLARDMQIIDKDLQDDFHKLRKLRNLIHLNSIDYPEYDAYGVEETNVYIKALTRFREQMMEDQKKRIA